MKFTTQYIYAQSLLYFQIARSKGLEAQRQYLGPVTLLPGVSQDNGGGKRGAQGDLVQIEVV